MGQSDICAICVICGEKKKNCTQITQINTDGQSDICVICVICGEKEKRFINEQVIR